MAIGLLFSQLPTGPVLSGKIIARSDRISSYDISLVSSRKFYQFKTDSLGQFHVKLKPGAYTINIIREDSILFSDVISIETHSKHTKLNIWLKEHKTVIHDLSDVENSLDSLVFTPVDERTISDDKPETKTVLEEVIHTFKGAAMSKREALGDAASYAPEGEEDKSFAYRKAPEARAITTSGSTARKGTAGKLTGTEINDLGKYELWEDLDSSVLSRYSAHWQIEPKKRISFQLLNELKRPLCDASIALIDKNNQVLWESKTDNLGKAELWYEASLQLKDCRVEMFYSNASFKLKEFVSYEEGINTVELPVDCYDPYAVDIAFVVDATGSMGDEIEYLKAEMDDIIGSIISSNKQLSIRTGAVFYRDNGDDYKTRTSPFSEDLNTTRRFIENQNAGGGGDFPELPDVALQAALNDLEWEEEARARLVFLVLDAPPHADEASLKRMKDAYSLAAAKGVKIIPVVSSGADQATEYLVRCGALYTNATSVFLTDHSGIGNSHIKPTTDSYEVKSLNFILKDIIQRSIEGHACSYEAIVLTANADSSIIDQNVSDTIPRFKPVLKDTVYFVSGNQLEREGTFIPLSKREYKNIKDKLDKDLDLQVYPNPTNGPLNLISSEPLDFFLLYDQHGKLLQRYQASGEERMHLSLANYPGGMYFIEAHLKDKTQRISFLVMR